MKKLPIPQLGFKTDHRRLIHDWAIRDGQDEGTAALMANHILDGAPQDPQSYLAFVDVRKGKCICCGKPQKKDGSLHATSCQAQAGPVWFSAVCDICPSCVDKLDDGDPNTHSKWSQATDELLADYAARSAERDAAFMGCRTMTARKSRVILDLQGLMATASAVDPEGIQVVAQQVETLPDDRPVVLGVPRTLACSGCGRTGYAPVHNTVSLVLVAGVVDVHLTTLCCRCIDAPDTEPVDYGLEVAFVSLADPSWLYEVRRAAPRLTD